MESSGGGVSPPGWPSPSFSGLTSCPQTPPRSPESRCHCGRSGRACVRREPGAGRAGRAGPLCSEGRRRRSPEEGQPAERAAPGPPSAPQPPPPAPGSSVASVRVSSPGGGGSGAARTVFMSGRRVSRQHGGLPDQRRHRLRPGGRAHRAAALRQRRRPHLQVSAGIGPTGVCTPLAPAPHVPGCPSLTPGCPRPIRVTWGRWGAGQGKEGGSRQE